MCVTLAPAVRRQLISEVFFTSILLFDAPPEQSTIEQWTDSEVKAALDWVHAAYLARQLDSSMPQPGKKPPCLQQFK